MPAPAAAPVASEPPKKKTVISSEVSKGAVTEPRPSLFRPESMTSTTSSSSNPSSQKQSVLKVRLEQAAGGGLVGSVEKETPAPKPPATSSTVLASFSQSQAQSQTTSDEPSPVSDLHDLLATSTEPSSMLSPGGAGQSSSGSEKTRDSSPGSFRIRVRPSAAAAAHKAARGSDEERQGDDASKPPLSAPSSPSQQPKMAARAPGVVRGVMDSLDLAMHQECLDQVEYDMGGLKEGSSLALARVSAFNLAKMCSVPEAVLRIRSSGKLQALFLALSRSAGDPLFVLCASTAMHFLSRDRLNMACMDTATVFWMMRVLENFAFGDANLAAPDLDQEGAELRARALGLLSHADPLVHSSERVRSVFLLLTTLGKACEVSAIVKDDLRESGGLRILARILHRYAVECHVGNDAWVAEALTLMAVLRVLEPATFLAPEVQLYLLSQCELPAHALMGDCGRDTVIPQLVVVMKKCWELIGRNRANARPVRAITEERLLDIVAGCLRVLINLSNASGLAAEAIGSSGGLDAALRCITYTAITTGGGTSQQQQQSQQPASQGEVASSHDLPVLALGLLINCVEFNRDNQARLGRATIRGGPTGERDAVLFLQDFFVRRLELANRVENDLGAAAATELRVLISYVSLLLGCLINLEDNYHRLKALVNNCFEQHVECMHQFIAFNRSNGLMSGDSAKSFNAVLNTFEGAERRCCPRHGDDRPLDADDQEEEGEEGDE
jgi:hypothetical protein